MRQAQQAIRDGKLDEALGRIPKELAANPNSLPANNAAGTLLDLMGNGAEARKYFQKAIDAAPDAAAKANAQRQMAMSYGFEGDCRNTVKYEQMVIAYWVTREQAEPQNAFYQQGEMANEAARVCIDSGDLETAATWYRKGTELGLEGARQPDPSQEPVELPPGACAGAHRGAPGQQGGSAEACRCRQGGAGWRSEDGRAAGALLPLPDGYVALYTGDTKTALDDLQKAVAMQGNAAIRSCNACSA